MNCDEFLPALEMGVTAQMQEARRHAASCLRCAAAAAALLEFKAALALHEPLSESARAVWANASRAPIARLAPRPKWTPILAGMLTSTAVCAVVLVLVLSKRSVEPAQPTVGQSAVQSAGPTTVIEHDSTADLAQLAAAVEALDDKLIALADEADRLDIRREIALTLNQYGHW